MWVSTTSFPHSTGVQASATNQENALKSSHIGKEEVNLTGRWLDHVCRISRGINNKAPEFSKVMKCQVNILVISLYISSEQSEIETYKK